MSGDHGLGKRGSLAGIQHDDGSGYGISGKRPAWNRDTGVELAIVYDGERPGGDGRQHDSADSAGWICERESGSQPGSNAGGRVLHGNLLPERRDNEHPILGGSSGDIGDPGAGAGAVDAVDASRAGGEQDVCGPGDCGVAGKYAGDIGRGAERATDIVLRSEYAVSGGRQALCGCGFRVGVAAVGREHDGSIDGTAVQRTADGKCHGECYGQHNEREAGSGLPGGPVCGSGFWRQAGSVSERAELDSRRNVRCAKFQRDAGDGIEPNDFDRECNGSIAVRNDLDG